MKAENPWQGDAVLCTHNSHPLGLDTFVQRIGKELSYNNYTDIDRMVHTIRSICAPYIRAGRDIPYVAIGVKHGNPCGVGVAADALTALSNMCEGYPDALFGGAIMCNFALDEGLARFLRDDMQVMLDVIVCPAIAEAVCNTLRRPHDNCRVLVHELLERAHFGANFPTQTSYTRHVHGGELRQSPYLFVLDFIHPELQVAGERRSREIEDDLLLAWAIGSTSNSNTITVVRDGMLLANAVGQQSRVLAAKLACLIRDQIEGRSFVDAVAYSDSYFPFPDGLEVLAKAGVSAVFASRGSVRDSHVFEAAYRLGVTLYTLPDTVCRGFFRH